MNLNKHNKDQSPNQQLTDEYNELIKNNPDEFFAKLDKGQIDQDCLSKNQQKIVKKRRAQMNRKDSKEAIVALWRFMRDYKILLIFLVVATVVLTAFNCLAVFGLRELTQLVNYTQHGFNAANPSETVPGGTASPNFTMLSVYAGVLIVFYFCMTALMWWQTRTMAVISQKVGYNVRKKLFAKIQKLPVKYFDQNSSGDLMSKFTNDVNNITNALTQSTATLLNGIFMALSMLISMFLMSSFLALITLALLPLMFLPMLWITKKSQPLFKENQRSLGRMNGFVEEMISGQNIVTLFNQEEMVSKNFQEVNNKLNNAAKKGQSISSWIFPYANFFINVMTLVITLIGIVFVVEGVGFGGIPLPNVTPNVVVIPETSTAATATGSSADAQQVIAGIATIAAFSMMARNFFQPFAQIANITTMLQLALAGANRAFQVFDENEEITPYEHLILNVVAGEKTEFHELDDASEKRDEKEMKEITEHTNYKADKNDILDDKHVENLEPFKTVTTNGAVKVNDLDFSYIPNKQILFDVNIDAKEGQTIAIVGPTGSGKSTFINLLTKFYDIEHGDIKIGGDVSIKEITKESMRRNVSIVLQDTYLFNVSIKQNIRYGKMDATDAEVIEAAKTANAHNFIMQLPNGYDTVLDDNGESLSQGQRQLLAIARAVLAPSSILILDEATSSIDTKTEIEIQTAMLRLMKNKTSFVIAHRLSTIQNADQILVLKDGHIIERGTHQELLDYNGFYASLYNSQFYEEE